MTSNEKLKIAIVYDADHTLLKEDPLNLLLKAREIKPEDFWHTIGKLQQRYKQEHPNSNTDVLHLSYIARQAARPSSRLYGITIEELKKIAEKNLSSLYFSGIPRFFQMIREEHPDCCISHNIISSGIEHMLTACELGEHIDRIFAYSFIDTFTPTPIIDGLGGSSSAFEKESIVKRISRGNLFGTQKKGFEYPIKYMFYFGSGETDREAFKLVKNIGGTAICVFDPSNPRSYEKAKQIEKEVNFILPANYSPAEEIYSRVSKRIKEFKQE